MKISVLNIGAGAVLLTALWCAPSWAGGPLPPWAKNWKSAPASGPLATAPKGSVFVGDHWHLENDFGAVLHGERWGRAGRLGAWKVPIQRVPREKK